ncbi:MAG: cyclic nucleotide-binding domain-containing protein [Candidatus Thermoplasmatota archaeon]|nr:cyclic nucleotide-binding domain-containing protein [Candidatus Thermoplasmatota archaeon]
MISNLKDIFDFVDIQIMEIGSLNSTNPALNLCLIQLAERYSLIKKYKPEETIFIEGEPGNTMFVIMLGVVKVLKQGSETGNLQEIGERGPGDFLGEMAIIEKSPRFATVIAETECEVMEFSKENFEKVVKEQPCIAFAVMKSTSGKLRESDSIRIAELEESNRLLNASNEDLIRLNSFLDCIIDQSPSAIFLTTRDGDIFRINKAATRMFAIGLPEENNQIDFFFHNFDFQKIRNNQNEFWHKEVIGLRNGEPFPVYISISSLSGHADSVLHLIMCQDISELKMLNETTVEIEKYESAQQTAIELAHDMKNFLGVFMGNVELVLSKLTPEQKEKSQNSIKAINHSFKEIIAFAENMMFNRISDVNFSSVNLEKLVKTLIRFYETQTRFRDIKFGLIVDKQFPTSIQLKEEHVRRAIVNLLSNASEAHLQSGKTGEKWIITELKMLPDTKTIEVKITDNGPGIEKKHISKLFKERFTTKADGHGIGLPSVARIVREHEGEITADSEIGRGTKFIIKLPIRVG